MSEQEEITLVVYWYAGVLQVMYSAMPLADWNNFGSDNDDYHYIKEIQVELPVIDENDAKAERLKREVREAGERLQKAQGELDEALAKKH